MKKESIMKNESYVFVDKREKSNHGSECQIIPDYVLDLWLPIIGADGFAVYMVYKRIVSEFGEVSIPLEKLAIFMAIELDALRKINKMLADCGFIKFTTSKRPKLKLECVRVKLLIPSTEVSSEIIQKYGSEDGYEPLIS
jgi:hypothetical protein